MSVTQIVAAGGALLLPESGNAKLERYVLDACGKAKPRVCFVPAASGDDVTYVARFYETYVRLGAAPAVLRFFRRTPQNLADFLSEYDVVHVGGGNTRSMLAVWKDWGFDRVLRDAWQRGVVMYGSSAGSICWFEQGVTDSLAGALTVMPALGFLRGSHCPHYDGEPERRPAYEGFVGRKEIEAGYACDDGAAAHFIGSDLHAAISARPNANVYRVELSEGRVRSRTLEMQRLA
jgi:dipeptidase E